MIAYLFTHALVDRYMPICLSCTWVDIVYIVLYHIIKRYSSMAVTLNHQSPIASYRNRDTNSISLSHSIDIIYCMHLHYLHNAHACYHTFYYSSSAIAYTHRYIFIYIITQNMGDANTSNNLFIYALLICQTCCGGSTLFYLLNRGCIIIINNRNLNA